ncbi:MAG: hypothetical protein ACI9MR_000068 [Myxococcota bacterium]|jgi:hypothetical protein
MFRNLVILLVAVGLIFYFLTRRRRPQRLFDIQVKEGGVVIRGPIPNREQEAVREYVHGLRLPVGAHIHGYPTEKGYDLRFSSTVRNDDRDRVRAFLKGSDSRLLH